MNRAALVGAISKALGRQQLVWFGTRGEDPESMSDIPQFAGSFSLISTMRSRPSVGSLSLEEISKHRPDLDTFDLDDHLRTEPVAELRDVILKVLSRPSALVTYRPTLFSSAIAFSRKDRCRDLGLFKGLQNAFEHKPWLESSIAALGLPAIRWQYIPDRELLDSRALFDHGSVMLRRSRTTGGVGLVRVESPRDLERLWPEEDEAFVSVARYISGGIPLNVGAVVFADGVTVHRASVQLIGIPGLTGRPFGYCGNDFVRAAALEPDILDRVEHAARSIGNWLRGTGYLGAFGVDFLLVEGVPLFTEVNPRLQGSTHLSCQLSVEREESCIIAEHIAAFLGLPAPARPPLREQMAAGVDLSQVVLHNVSDGGRRIDALNAITPLRGTAGFNRADVLTDPEVLTEEGGTIARVSIRSAVTDTGFELIAPWRDAVAHCTTASEGGGGARGPHS